MFKYEPYALRDDAVKDFLQSYLNTSRSRYRKFWVAHGCDDRNPHPSTSPGDWYECCRFWRSEEGKQVSERMTAVRACVGKSSQGGDLAPCHIEEFMVCLISSFISVWRGRHCMLSTNKFLFNLTVVVVYGREQPLATTVDLDVEKVDST